MLKYDTEVLGGIMKKSKLLTGLLIGVLATATAVVGGCSGNSNSEPTSQAYIDLTPRTSEVPSSEAVVEEVEDTTPPPNSYRSELTNEWIDNSLEQQRPVAVMVDNELTALDHYGINQADVVYELMNSTANGRVTRLMCIVKDWKNLEQFGSIRSTRPTNILLAAEYNAILVHDGGPFYINDYIAKPYCNNLSGGFARFANGKATEFTEYVTSDTYTGPKGTFKGLTERIKDAGYSENYNSYYKGEHFLFAGKENKLDGYASAAAAKDIYLPHPHNKSELHYNEQTKKYEYKEYGKAHIDPLDGNKVLSFDNVILQKTGYRTYDANGYMIYDVVNSSEGLYITRGKVINIKWSKNGETDITKYVITETGEEIQLNTGKTYISLIPNGVWGDLTFK